MSQDPKREVAILMIISLALFIFFTMWTVYGLKGLGF